jgi:PAS domain S-box-containing protein
MSQEADIIWAVVIGSIALFTLSSFIIVFVVLSQRKIIALQNKQLEQTQKSELRYSELFNNVNDIVYVLTLEGEILQVNNTATRLLGYHPAEITGKTIKNFIHSKYHLGLEPCLRKTRFEGESRGHLPIISKSGTTLVFEYSNSVIFEGNHATAIRGIARNVTEQQQMQELLRDNEEKFRHLVKFLPIAMAVFCEEKICYVNDATVTLCKAESETQLLKKTLSELLETELHTNISELMKSVINQREDVSHTKCILKCLDSYPLKSHDSKAKKGSGTKIREIELPRKRILFIKTLQKPCS